MFPITPSSPGSRPELSGTFASAAATAANPPPPIRPRTPDDLQRFVARYGGEIVQDNSVPALPAAFGVTLTDAQRALYEWVLEETDEERRRVMRTSEQRQLRRSA